MGSASCRCERGEQYANDIEIRRYAWLYGPDDNRNDCAGYGAERIPHRTGTKSSGDPPEALATSDGSAQVINLNGWWQCVAQCFGPPGGVAYITQNGWDLNIANAAGVASRAWIDYPGHIWVHWSKQGAIYSPDGFTLQFDNGTVWQRAPV